MKIEWPILIAALFTIGGFSIILLAAIRKKNRAFNRLDSVNKQMDGELLRARTEHAKEIADLTAEHAKRITASQKNVNDLTALLKGRGNAEWQHPPSQAQR